MSKLLARLQDASRSGVYRAPRADDVVDVLRGADFDVVRIDLPEVADKAALLARLAEALAFPEWFGGNWDALEDCLTDLSWRQGARHVLLIERFEALRVKGFDDFGTLLDVLEASAAYWRERGRPFFAVLVDPAHTLSLPDLYRARHQ
ncbi:MAG TPA: barstar family protein [Burkholderiales bacterium]|nr:barstar family protein [Burkholderiales bacterium]